MGRAALGGAATPTEAGRKAREGAEVPLLNRVPQLRAKLQREDGQTIIEYAFVAGGVSVVLLAAFVATGILDDFAALLGELFPD